ncbi:MAG: hypothetical protein AAFR61_08295 [Bacteroidota bacterium]
MKTDFRTYQKFQNQEDAQWWISLMESNDIPFEFENISSGLDPSIFGGELMQEWVLRLPGDRFQDMHHILKDQVVHEIDSLDSSYYLFQFSLEELEDVLVEVGNWNPLDVQMAQELLRRKGIDYTYEEIDQLQQEHLRQLRKAQPADTFTLFIGYLAAIMGGLGALMVGHYLQSTKRVDPMGKRFYLFDQASRKQGRTIYRIGLVMFFVWVIAGFSLYS